MAAQVATSQTNEAKRGEDAQTVRAAVSQVTQLEAQSREAIPNRNTNRPPI